MMNSTKLLELLPHCDKKCPNIGVLKMNLSNSQLRPLKTVIVSAKITLFQRVHPSACACANIQHICTTIHIGLFLGISGGRITVPVCDLVMIRRGGTWTAWVAIFSN